MDMPFNPRDGEAKLRYGDAGFQVLVPGRYVICAVTGMRIDIERLKYWSAERQEAYVNANAALQGMRGQRVA